MEKRQQEIDLPRPNQWGSLQVALLVGIWGHTMDLWKSWKTNIRTPNPLPLRDLLRLPNRRWGGMGALCAFISFYYGQEYYRNLIKSKLDQRSTQNRQRRTEGFEKARARLRVAR